MNKPLATLMAKEMSRKEFIGVIGFAVASVFGLGTLLSLLGYKGIETHLPKTPISSGFGAGAYGQ